MDYKLSSKNTRSRNSADEEKLDPSLGEKLILLTIGTLVLPLEYPHTGLDLTFPVLMPVQTL